MRKTKFFGFVLLIISIGLIHIFLPFFTTLSDVYANKEKPLAEYECGEKGQILVNSGNYDEAILLLNTCIKTYPNSDWLISIYGRAYYLQGDLQNAEEQFRKALEINKDNQIAKTLIQEVRKTTDLLVDRSTSFWISIWKRKIADLIVLIIGVWVGTLLTFLSESFMGWYAKKNFSKALARDDFDKATDILEKLVHDYKKEELRKNMNKMLSKYSLEETEKILIDFVDDKTLQDKLLFFAHRVHEKSQRK